MELREPPVAGSEADTLVGSLERQRRIIEWKCGGLDADGMRATTAASTITLGGLLKHLALVEDDYFSNRLLGRSPGEPWEGIDWDADPEWEWRTGTQDAPEDVRALWRAAVERSRATTAEILAQDGLDFRPKGISDPQGNAPSFRRILIDLIEEYARHAGHADIIRESIDGLVGEDPPGGGS